LRLPGENLGNDAQAIYIRHRCRQCHKQAISTLQLAHVRKHPPGKKVRHRTHEDSRWSLVVGPWQVSDAEIKF